MDNTSEYLRWLAAKRLLESQGIESPPFRQLKKSLSKNTLKAYADAVRRYQFIYQGPLPAKTENILEYVNNQKQSMSPGSLKIFIAAISKWHSDIHFEDPTKDTAVRIIIEHIQKTSSHETRHRPRLKFSDLKQMAGFLDEIVYDEKVEDFLPQSMRYLLSTRNKSILLLGYWCSLSHQQIVNIHLSDLQFNDDGVNIRLSEPSAEDNRIFVPRLKHYCPTKSIEDWINASLLKNGPLFRKITRWGIEPKCFIPNSLDAIISSISKGAGTEHLFSYTALRKGLALNKNNEKIFSEVEWPIYRRIPWATDL